MIERVREALRREPLIGVVFSIAVHAVLLLALLWVHPTRTATQKRGDALIVELPNLDEPASRGTPGPQADAPLSPAASTAPPSRPTPAVRPTPPRPPATARPAPAAEPREARRAVASAPQPTPTAERGDMPAVKSAPQPVTATKPEASPQVASPPPSAPPSSPGQVAMVPPTPPDIRSALRRGGGGGGIGPGGAGGSGVGRGGIEGAPVALNSTDPNFSDYLERVRALIERHWVYPCVKDPQTMVCEVKSGRLVVEFGILKNGQLAFVDLHQSSGYVIMDDSATNAIKLASPFPAIPAALMADRKGTGLPIVANFHYVLQTDLKNVIR
jgi:protein TonB